MNVAIDLGAYKHALIIQFYFLFAGTNHEKFGNFGKKIFRALFGNYYAFTKNV